MPDVFLSYTREDQAVAQRFAEAFEAQGLTVWWDATLRSGESYDEVTEEALRTAKAVVVLWSKKSVVSRWVRAEATLADRNRTLVPATIEPCERPIMFELTQTADLCHWTGEARDPGWRAFLADVGRFVWAKSEPATPSPPETTPSTAAPEATRDKRPSIAVLPFVNRSGVSEDDIFAHGMVEDLTGALSISRRMKVIAASATAVYRKGAADLRQIGRDLGVRYLLEGNLRRVGDDLRVTAQLVEAEDGDILWTQKFDRPLAEVSALQEALVTEVAAHLGVEVQRAEMEHALRKPGDITAWEAVLRAEAYLSRTWPVGVEAAAAEARRAIRIAPDYDLAHATLALALSVRLDLVGGEDPELTREVFDAAARACALETGDPIVLARIAVALSLVGKAREALSFAERAVAANPNLELPRIALGNLLLRLGRADDAIAEFETAQQLAPNSAFSHGVVFWRGVAEFRTGQTDQSLELTRASLRIRSFLPSRIHCAVCLALLDRWDEAHDVMRALRDASPAASFALVEKHARSTLYVGMEPGRIDECVAVARKLWNDASSEPGPA